MRGATKFFGAALVVLALSSSDVAAQQPKKYSDLPSSCPAGVQDGSVAQENPYYFGVPDLTLKNFLESDYPQLIQTIVDIGSDQKNSEGSPVTLANVLYYIATEKLGLDPRDLQTGLDNTVISIHYGIPFLPEIAHRVADDLIESGRMPVVVDYPLFGTVIKVAIGSDGLAQYEFPLLSGYNEAQMQALREALKGNTRLASGLSFREAVARTLAARNSGAEIVRGINEQLNLDWRIGQPWEDYLDLLDAMVGDEDVVNADLNDIIKVLMAHNNATIVVYERVYEGEDGNTYSMQPALVYASIASPFVMERLQGEDNGGCFEEAEG